MSNEGLIVGNNSDGSGLFFYMVVMPHIDPDIFSSIFMDEFRSDVRIVSVRAYSN